MFVTSEEMSLNLMKMWASISKVYLSMSQDVYEDGVCIVYDELSSFLDERSMTYMTFSCESLV